MVSPRDADARVRLGHTLGELGRHKEAAAELRKALDAEPDMERTYQDDADALMSLMRQIGTR